MLDTKEDIDVLKQENLLRWRNVRQRYCLLRIMYFSFFVLTLFVRALWIFKENVILHQRMETLEVRVNENN